jgi:hypothetical protein
MDILWSLRRLWAWLLGPFTAPLALPGPPPMAPIPEPGTLGFVGLDAGGPAVSDLKLFGWLKHLQSEVPFPQPSYGRVEPPATPAELIERLADAHRALEEAVALAASRERPSDADIEPEWFVVLADQLVPLMCWYVGLGLPPTAVAVPQGLIDLVNRAKKLPMGFSHLLDGRVGDSIESFREQLERSKSRHAEMQAANLVIWQVQLEAMLRPLVDRERGSVSVTFGFPPPGARIADLVPPPAAGSPTHGNVTRVLVPALLVTLNAPLPGVSATDPMHLSRGPHLP